MFTDTYNPDNYSNPFKIRRLIYTPKNTDSNTETLQEILKNKYDKSELSGIIFQDDKRKLTIKGVEDKGNYILVAFSECDHLAKVSVTPTDNSSFEKDTHAVNNLDSYQVFMLIDNNDVLANIQISSRKVYAVINQFLKRLNIPGATREALNLESIDIINSEGLRGFEVHGSFSSEDTLSHQPKQNKVIEFFKDMFDAPPPITDSPLIGKFSMNISDNQPYIVNEELIEKPELLIDYLGTGLTLVTGKGKKITGQSFVQEETFYLRPYTKNSVSLSAAFATLSYYKENL